tara:strand:- start:397 stop:507 length:111 start_codon:yes stop_codon:yes gene_type:complete
MVKGIGYYKPKKKRYGGASLKGVARAGKRARKTLGR